MAIYRHAPEIASHPCAEVSAIYDPIPEHHRIYAELYKCYREIHDAFGTAEWSGKLNHVMKQLISLREQQRSRA